MYKFLLLFFVVFYDFESSFGVFSGGHIKRLNDVEMAEDQGRSIERCRYFWKTRSRSVRQARSVPQVEAKTLDDVIFDTYDDSKGSNEQDNKRRLNFKPQGIWLQQTPSLGATDSPPPRLPWHKDWNGAVIPYYVDGNSYDASMTEHIKRAFEYVAHVTCIRLELLRQRPEDNSEFPWVHISNPDGLYQCVHSNHLKKNIGRQWVVLGYECLSVGEIAHEVMHVLGFGHEHARPDRDAYISIDWDSIKPGYKKYFEISNETTYIKMDYDFTSVMHYPARAFTRNGKVTIRTQQGEVIGQRQGFSEMDLQKIKAVYDQDCTTRNDLYMQEVCPKIMEGITLDSSLEQPSSSDEEENYYQEHIWKHGILQYTFKNPEEFAPVEKGAIRSVMEHISSETCLEFNEGISARRHASRQIKFQYAGDGPCPCPSVEPGYQTINLTKSCFNSLNDLLHIIVHTLGFEHQHLAHDRDQYVVITWKDVDADVRAEMENKLPKSASLGFRYDYDSIMHMPWMQFINGKQVKMYPVWNYGWNMGHWRGLSEIDVAKIHRLYNDECKARDVAGNDIEEPAEAMVPAETTVPDETMVPVERKQKI